MVASSPVISAVLAEMAALLIRTCTSPAARSAASTCAASVTSSWTGWTPSEVQRVVAGARVDLAGAGAS
jgi:hypothetical protein